VVAGEVAVVVADGLFGSEQPTSVNMIVTTRSGMASTRLWLNEFTSRRLPEIVCGPGL